MAIQVTCPKCLKRFQVSDKFAGKSGPCPACKSVIRVPEKSEEVVVHAPADDAPKDSTGQSVLKPIRRKETDVSRAAMLIAGGVVVGLMLVALGFRLTAGEEGVPMWARVVGILLLAPPLVRYGYSFVHDSELEPYVGVELRNRTLICSLLFAALWLAYAFLPTYVFDLARPSEMEYWMFGMVLAVMLGLGALASVGSFEVEFSSGLAHAGFYIVSVLILALIAGITVAGATP